MKKLWQRWASKICRLVDAKLSFVIMGDVLCLRTCWIGFVLQIVYVSVGASRMKKKGDGMETPSLLPPPRREHIPTLLLLLPEYFETLFKLMHTLSTIPGKTGVSKIDYSYPF